ncbi:GATOR2 complex protein WDR59-like isoform X3 [Tubulanus polymorphus]|uniref:GATOR2 complex protein WDR59-like isoform X3 n=2 Tax=Tubulanus polymorphus TaxID=672921 RepID=UPI003DA49096
MAVRWSSENVVAEYKDLQANCMAVDCVGHYGLLGGRRLLALVDLHKPSDAVKKFARNSKWEISAMRWNPHQSHGNLFVTASNQRADIFAWAEGQAGTKAGLKSHTRVISDLDWSPFDPNILATCSMDTFTFLWDIRDARRPHVSLQAVAGVSQVKWNKVNTNLLATTHDGDIRIWDPRKGTSPVQYIAAHLSKIHGLDWSPGNEFTLATSSQDCTVKFWDVTSPRKATSMLSSSAPVWRARFTPFGQGMVTVVVPQLRRGENSLLLWNKNDLLQPVHTFVGHTDVVLEFEWRKQVGVDGGDYQLVTWSKDQSLRIWRIDPHLQKLCGPDSNDELLLDNVDDMEEIDGTNIQSVIGIADGERLSPDDLSPLQSTPPSKQIPSMTEQISPHQPKTLHQEFSLVNINIPNVTVDEMDAFKRTCTVSVVSSKHLVKLIMSFPVTYPNNAAPTFQIAQPTTIDQNNQTKLLKVLKDTSLQHVKRNRSCLEPCLRQLVSCLGNITLEERVTPDSDTPYNLQQPVIQQPTFLPLYSYGSFQDSSIPFPRTSGARFCGAGHLVTFTRSSDLKKSTTEITPKSLSALSAYTQSHYNVRTPQQSQPFNLIFNMPRSPPNNDGVSISNFYNYKGKQRLRPKKSLNKESSEHSSRSKKSSSSKMCRVMIYDASVLLPIHKYLAENYVLNPSNVQETCTKNASVAASIGRKDLAQMWSLAALSASPMLSSSPNPDAGPPWAYMPFGRNLIKSWLDHYSIMHDVQTLAMICCVFGAKDGKPKQISTTSSPDRSQFTDSGSDYSTIVSAEDEFASSFSHSWSFPGIKLKRSNSWSDSFEDYKFSEVRDPADIEREKHEENMKFLDSSVICQYDQFKIAYARILYLWGLHNKVAEVLKYVSTPPPGHKGIEFVTLCQICHKESRGVQCGHCKNYAFQCSICHIAIKGASNFCLACGHGGHAEHMKDWFIKHTICPTGCGCNCLKDNPMVGI